MVCNNHKNVKFKILDIMYLKSNANEEINTLICEWFVSAIAKYIPISGPIGNHTV